MRQSPKKGAAHVSVWTPCCVNLSALQAGQDTSIVVCLEDADVEKQECPIQQLRW